MFGLFFSLKRETWKTLLSLTGGNLGEKIRLMPDINNFLTKDHLDALEKRLSLVFATIEFCKKVKQAQSTLNSLHK